MITKRSENDNGDEPMTINDPFSFSVQYSECLAPTAPLLRDLQWLAKGNIGSAGINYSYTQLA